MGILDVVLSSLASPLPQAGDGSATSSSSSSFFVGAEEPSDEDVAAQREDEDVESDNVAVADMWNDKSDHREQQEAAFAIISGGGGAGGSKRRRIRLHNHKKLELIVIATNVGPSGDGGTGTSSSTSSAASSADAIKNGSTPTQAAVNHGSPLPNSKTSSSTWCSSSSASARTLNEEQTQHASAHSSSTDPAPAVKKVINTLSTSSSSSSSKKSKSSYKTRPAKAKRSPTLPVIQEEDAADVDEAMEFCPSGEAIARVAVVQGSAALHAYASVKSAPAGSVSMACLPIIVPFSMPYDNVVDFFPLNERATKYQKTLVCLTTTQGTLSLVQLMLGDLMGGFLGGMMAATGSYASSSTTAVSWLPTYTVLSFLNGSVSTLGMMEKMVFSKYAFFALSNPLVVNLVHGLVVAVPLTSFFGCYYSYGYLREIRLLHANGTMVDTSVEQSRFVENLLARGAAVGNNNGARTEQLLPARPSMEGASMGEEHQAGEQRGPTLVPFSGVPHTITSSGDDSFQ
ncbi:unnamed protein product [Amoebophrya sp. A25]|nr:unnamed protein product [Amoebophrya sp. A25]|eukprot:GSA25T00004960001.1